MGADLLIANLWSAPDPTFDWEAGRQALAELTDAEVLILLDYAPWVDEGGDEAAAAAACRARLDDQLTLLAGELAGDGGGAFRRYLTWFDTPDRRWRCWLTGGMSWGDSPSDLFDAISELWAVPKVLAAVGFRTEAEVSA